MSALINAARVVVAHHPEHPRAPHEARSRMVGFRVGTLAADTK